MLERASSTRWIAALAAVALAPVSLRIAAIADRTGGALPPDALGFLSDGATAFLVLPIVLGVGALSRAAAVAVVVLWGSAQYVNYEHILGLDAPASLVDAGYLLDPTFLSGSIAFTRPVLIAVVLVASAILAWVGVRGATARLALATGAAGVILTGLHAVVPASLDVPGWRQIQPLERDLRILARAAAASSPPASPDPAAAMLELVPGLRADLSGAPRLPEGERPRNVLLVVLESVSGLHIESLAAEQGREADVDMPGLDAIARENLRYATFIAHQRKTNRGLYAMLCGELPNLEPGLPKMSAFVEGGWRVCLPEVLRAAGYETVYLQAAPLAFMMKDQFMPLAGFHQSHGREWFGASYAPSGWGVDDRAFFEQAEAMVETLAGGERPWFLTLLNVGSHHPYVLPDDFAPDVEPAFRRSALYLDRAFSAFYRRLEARGLLDDALVLITSDESFGLSGFLVEPLTKILSQNWGFLVARLPERRNEVVREPFGLVDLPLSILDYLGLAERGAHFFGRSVFRRYDAGRWLFFANVNLRSNGAIDPSGHLLLCLNDYRRCLKYAVDDDRIFGAERRELAWSPEKDGVVQALAARSAPAVRTGDRVLALLTEPEIVLRGKAPRILHGGQYVDVGAESWLEVEYEVSAREGDGVAYLLHILSANDNEETLLRRAAFLRRGQGLRLRYTYRPGHDVRGLQVRTVVRLSEGSELVLRHGAARMAIHSGAGGPAPGLHIQTFERTR
jgi:hypothetical protein